MSKKNNRPRVLKESRYEIAKLLIVLDKLLLKSALGPEE